MGKAFSVDDFRSSFSAGLASPALFRFRLLRLPRFMTAGGASISIGGVSASTGGAPSTAYSNIEAYGNSVIGSLSSKAVTELPMHVKAASIMDQNIQWAPTAYYGKPVKYPTQNSTGDLTLEIVSSGDFWERDFFNIWQNYIIDFGIRANNPTFTIGYYDDYTTEALVEVYNEEGKIVYSITMDGVWPVQVASIGLDWASKDTALTFSVDLEVAYWSAVSSNYNSSTSFSIGGINGSVNLPNSFTL